MSPEQARGQELDARTDLFSFGVVLYEMATGHVPFAAGSAIEMLLNVLEARPVPIRDLAPEHPAALGRIDLILLSHDQHPDNLDRAGRALVARVPTLTRTPEFWAEYDGGDHIIVVGRVLDLGMQHDAGPLLFFRGKYGRLVIGE